MLYSTRSITQFIRSEFRTGEYQIRSETKERIDEAAAQYITDVTSEGWQRTIADGRSTIRPRDIHIEQPPSKEDLTLSIHPTRSQVEQTLPDDALLSELFVVAVTALVEEYISTVVVCAEQFMLHADRSSLAVEDIELYFSLFENLPAS